MCPTPPPAAPRPPSSGGDAPSRDDRAGRGLFIVLEGIDGSGTTTQAQLLTEHLAGRGHRAYATNEPSSGPVGMLIRLALSGRLLGPTLRYHDADEDRDDAGDTTLDARTLALLFAADRMDHLVTQVEPNLARGRHVVCDRYLLSSLAYQGLSLPEEWVLEINRHARVPDLTFYLDVPVEHARMRMRAARWTRDLYEDDWHQRRIRERYQEVVARGLPGVGPVVVVDASRPRAEVTDEITRALDERLAARAADPDPQLTLLEPGAAGGPRVER
ncbi:MAG TPA: dTMP kinase [Longimicrobiaceae bacterium]|nr:dTMP kinase [Longimicrobiaceae bacterium]